MTLGHAASALFKKIGEDALEDDGNAGGGVGDLEAHCQPVALSLQASIFNEPAHSKSFPGGSLFRGNLRRTEEENQIFIKCVQYQERRQTEAHQPGSNKENSLMTFFHDGYFLPNLVG